MQELENLQPYVYKTWLEGGSTDIVMRLWTNGREPIEGSNDWFWDDTHSACKQICSIKSWRTKTPSEIKQTLTLY